MSERPEPVLLDVSPEGVAVILLNRPAKNNAIDELLIAGLADALETLKGADHVRVVFLRGAGDNFCAGGDSDWAARQADRDVHENEADFLAFGRTLKALHDLPQLTVALVEGEAYGGGAGLVAACDWAVARADARFRFPEVRVGGMPAMLAPYLIEAVGARTARGLAASALPFGAAQALAFGLVHEIVENEGALEGVLKRFAGLALENAPSAVERAKQIMRDFAGKRIDDGLAKDGARRVAEQRASAEGIEGAAALIGRRPPQWDRGQ